MRKTTAVGSGGSSMAACWIPLSESEDIKWELWKIIYGVWDHIKNSGDFPDAKNLNARMGWNRSRQA